MVGAGKELTNALIPYVEIQVVIEAATNGCLEKNVEIASIM